MKKYCLSLLGCLFAFCASAQTIWTISDTGGAAGYTPDGIHVSKSMFDAPFGLTCDDEGSLYVADVNNSVVRKIDHSGIVTTIAGKPGESGDSGDGGPATAALLDYPYSIAFDSTGNIYIACYNNCRIRKIDKVTGIISTYAGGGSDTASGIPATSAQILLPTQIGFDKKQNLYIVVTGSGVGAIRVVSPEGIISTLISAWGWSTPGSYGYGDGGPAIKARLSYVGGMAVDANANVYFTDFWERRIRRINKFKNIYHYSGNGPYTGSTFGDGGPAKKAVLTHPRVMCTDNAGNVYFDDDNINRLRKIDHKTKIITTIAGTGDEAYNGNGMAALLTNIERIDGLTFDKKRNVIYYTDRNRIRKIEGLAAEPDQDPDEKDDDEVLHIAAAGMPGFSVFPNPASNALTITGPAAGTDLRVIDMMGNIMLCEKAVQGVNTIDVSGLAAGNYQLTVTCSKGGKPVMLKFTKQ